MGNKTIFWWFDKLGILKATNTSTMGKIIHHVFFKDNTKLQVDNIIWSTGFIQNYSWLDIDDIFNNKGMIKHQRGLTAIRGLYFLGLPWQYKRGSSLLQGVGEDAKYIINHMNS
ncbi:hypothetical protein MPH47_09335 [Psychrobacillus psychrodurans]|uniref:hypothetical protein n=1 Tax=Psychrobacillus psychrodurans TaxID=126157 RepID=UPI001F4E8FA8|nr:hypothetical protein [Psychrobacillus psychrodurans]MCK1997425.1 hypothetical protein [Psychrobacillus psychrodurans]